jgi:hypothetical protein
MSNFSIAGHSWNLWKGSHKTWQVISFVSADGDLSTFDADLNMFLGAFILWWLYLSLHAYRAISFLGRKARIPSNTGVYSHFLLRLRHLLRVRMILVHPSYPSWHRTIYWSGKSRHIELHFGNQ